MSVYFPRAVNRPREMPELRVALLQMAVPNGSWAQAEFQKLMMDLTGGRDVSTITKQDGNTIISGPRGYSPDEMENMGDWVSRASQQADANVRWYQEMLPEAQLIHIEEKMCEFIAAAADAAPDNLTLTLSDAPAPAGLVVFSKPMLGTDAGPENPGNPVRVDGLIWGPTRLPSRSTHWYQDPPESDPAVYGISIASLRMLAPDSSDSCVLCGGVFEGHGHNPKPLAEEGRCCDNCNQTLVVPTRLGQKVSPSSILPRVTSVMWIPLGRSDWIWGDTLNTPIEVAPNPSPNQHASMMEDRRLLSALWATINQKRLVDTEIVLPERHAVKRMVRAGFAGQDNRVQIIHLRRSEYRMLDQTESTGHKLKFRVPVRPHYKRQPYGPGRKLRRIILVPRHWRGPDDAPIKHTERIWEVDR